MTDKMSLYFCAFCGDHTKPGRVRLDGYAKAPTEDATCRCGKCGRQAKLVQKNINTVHYAYPDPNGFPGTDERTWKIACNDRIEEFGMLHVTATAEAVSCPDCAASDVCQDMIRRERRERPIMIAKSLPRK